MKSCDKNINKTLAMAEDMMRLADQGDADREDVGCGILYGVLRDSAFKLKKLAETEKRNHHAKAGKSKQRPPRPAVDTCSPRFQTE